jgi:hypothetical protein
MSDETVIIVLAAASFVVLLAWVPFLTVVCSPCRRFLLRRSLQKQLSKQPSWTPAWKPEWTPDWTPESGGKRPLSKSSGYLSDSGSQTARSSAYERSST